MKIKTLLLFIGATILLTSCMFTEELHINNNGSGNYAFKVDMSKMMDSMGQSKPQDSLKGYELLDTIMYFKDIIKENKDSIAKLSKTEQNLIEELKDLKLHMLIDEKNNKMLLNFNLDFKNVSELEHMQEKINKAQALSDKKKNKDKSISSNAEVTYSLHNNTFSRNVTLKNLSKEEQEEFKKSTSILDGTYRLVYHFEKKIKSVSFKDVTFSNDKKTITIEIGMDTLMKNPKLLDFQVKLK